MKTFIPVKSSDRDYIYGKTIGKGASGEVRIVADPSANEIYACKSIHKKLREHIVCI